MHPFLFVAALALGLQALAAHGQGVIAQIPAPADSRAIVVNPATNRIYVANDGANTVTVIDGQTHATAAIPVCRGPQYLAVDPAANRVYAACGRSASLAVIDGATHAVRELAIGGAGPMVVDPVTQKVYMVRLGSPDEATIINPAGAGDWYSIALLSYGPTAIDLNPSTRQLFVSTYTTGDVRVVDMQSTSDHPPSVGVGVWSKATHVAVNRATGRAYVLTEDSRGPIAIVDGATLRASFIAPAGRALGPRGVVVNERTNKAFAAFDREVVVVDGATGGHAFVTTAASTVGIAANPETNRVYVASSAGALTAIDGGTLSAVAVGIPEGARAIAVNPVTNRVYVAGSAGVTVVEGAGAASPPPPPPANDAVVNAQGLWWASPAGAESGWGVHLTHQGETLFGTWFTYDLDGGGLWLVMSNGARTGPNTYSGTLYRTTGPPFSSEAFDPARVTRTAVGSATFTFTDASSGSFSATVNGQAITKAITRQVFAAPTPVCAPGGAHAAQPNYQDLWWRSPAGSESGWGLNIAHQGDVLFVTWFTYGADGRGLWLVGSNVARTGPAQYSGTLYRASGPPYDASPWPASRVGLAPAGTVSLAFSDATNGVLAYTVDGHSASRPITRQVYASPVSICR